MRQSQGDSILEVLGEDRVLGEDLHRELGEDLHTDVDLEQATSTSKDEPGCNSTMPSQDSQSSDLHTSTDNSLLADFGEWFDGDDSQLESGLRGGDPDPEKGEDGSTYPFYYVRNFFIVFEHVMKKDKHLFLPEEIHIVELFPTLPEEAQR